MPREVRKKLGNIVDDAFLETKNILDQLEGTTIEPTQKSSIAELSTSNICSNFVVVTDFNAQGIVIQVDLKLKNINNSSEEKNVSIRVDMPEFEPSEVSVNGVSFISAERK